jgi:hypothetical protein
LEKETVPSDWFMEPALNQELGNVLLEPLFFEQTPNLKRLATLKRFS